MAASPPRPADSRAGVTRLTARGVVCLSVLAALVALCALLGGVLLAGGVARAAQGARPLPVRYHVVMPGDTLWGIATREAPRDDPREVVARLVELNALRGAGLRVGQRIAVPVEG